MLLTAAAAAGRARLQEIERWQSVGKTIPNPTLYRLKSKFK
jgi:hypothetical protein